MANVRDTGIPSGASVGNTHALEVVLSSASNYAVSWDEVGTPSGDVQVLVLAYFEHTSNSNRTLRAFLHGSGSAGNENAYFSNLNFGATNETELYRLLSGTVGNLGGSDEGLTRNQWIWIRLDRTSDTIRIRAWADGTTEPGTWAVSITDTSHGSGWVGLSGFDRSVSNWFAQIGVGTGGDEAPSEPVVAAVDATIAHGPTFSHDAAGTLSADAEIAHGPTFSHDADVSLGVDSTVTHGPSYSHSADASAGIPTAAIEHGPSFSHSVNAEIPTSAEIAHGPTFSHSAAATIASPITIITSRDPDFTVRLFGPLGTPQAGVPLDEITFSGIDTTFSINDEIPGGFGTASIGGVIQRNNEIVPAWLPRPVTEIVPFAHTVITAGMSTIWEGQAVKPDTDERGEIVGFNAVGYWSALNDHEFESSSSSLTTTGDVLRALVLAIAPFLNIGSDAQFTDPQVSHALEDFDSMTGGAIWDQITKEGDGLGIPVDLAVWRDRTIWSQRRQAPDVPAYTIQPGDPGVQINERSWDDLWARVRTRYTDSAGDEQVTDWEEATITDAPRNRGKTLSGGQLTEAAAEQIAKTFLDDHRVRRWGASITLEDGRGLPTYDGGERPGYLVMPGEWCAVLDYHPMVIVKRTYDSTSRRTQLTLDHQPRNWQLLLDRMKKTTEYTREGLNPVTGGRAR